MKYKDYSEIRRNTEKITQGLSERILKHQPRPEVSPPQWHLAHTTWFFEKFILLEYKSDYSALNPKFDHYFNSYYKQIGTHWLQHEREKIPVSYSEIIEYRNHVDQEIISLLQRKTDSKIFELISAGLHHEEQHQELLYMDIKAVQESLNEELSFPIHTEKKEDKEWFQVEEQIIKIGHSGKDFSYDNEKPQHKFYQTSALIRNHLVTVKEFQEFIDDNGYKKSQLWLSMGWDWKEKNQIQTPHYWNSQNNLESPVSHISYFEAYAFAKWKRMRLPTEQEHEVFDQSHDTEKPLWAWTTSQYSAYPGFKPFSGGLSEYNGKFMCNQFVLRGACQYTPQNHWRVTYRNFYSPEQRWMFSGIRLATDV